MDPRPARLPLLLIPALIATIVGAQAPAPETSTKPRVRLIATGGTIATRTGGRLNAEEVLELVPELGQYARAEAEQFANVASTSITSGDWLQLSRRINELFAQDSGLAGVVVTSGTDTLEELAYFLHLTVRSPRPVVVVGSMRNISAVGYEGAANLLAGFRVAATPESRNKGVLVVMNDEINSAREVTKTDSLRLETFQSRGYGLLGVVDPDRVVFHRLPIKRHTARSEFDMREFLTLPRVDIIFYYQDAPADLVRAVVDQGARGIVIAAAGADTTGASLAPGITYAVKRGVIVVMATRTGGGRISLGSIQRGTIGVVAAEDLPPLKARVLLMLALTRSRTVTQIQRMFLEY